MKLLKFGIRLWITLTSIFSFLAGWILLANAPKPNQSGALGSGTFAPLKTVEPLRLFSEFQPDDDDDFQSRPFFSTQPQNQARRSFRTGGS